MKKKRSSFNEGEAVLDEPRTPIGRHVLQQTRGWRMWETTMEVEEEKEGLSLVFGRAPEKDFGAGASVKRGWRRMVPPAAPWPY